MAKKVSELHPVDEYIKVHKSPIHESQKARFSDLEQHINNVIEYNHPEFMTEAQTNGFRGSSVKKVVNTKGKAKVVWEEAGLDHVGRELYSSNEQVVAQARKQENADAGMIGLEHYVLTAMESMQGDHDVQLQLATFANDVKAGIYDQENGAQLRLNEIKRLAKSTLYMEDQDIDTYIKAARATGDKAHHSFRKVLGNVTQGHGERLVKGITDKSVAEVTKDSIGINKFKATIYDLLDEKDRPQSVIAYTRTDPNIMLNILHGNSLDKEKRKQLYDAGIIREE